MISRALFPPMTVAGLLSAAAGHAAAESPSRARATPELVVVVGKAHRNAPHMTLQHTAASSSLLSAARLQSLGVTSTRDLSNLTPNLYQPRATVGYSNSNYFIRGIGELDPQGEPSVGTYIDGVYLTRAIGTMQELLDIDDIQIDRGPVGFTTGHQAEGGVRISTVVPDDHPRFDAEAGYGSYNEWKAGLAASGPIVADKVYASIAVEHHARDGVDHNVTLGKDENNIDYTQARAKLRFTPTATTDIILAFDGTSDGSTNRGYGNLLDADRYALHSAIYPKNNYSEAGFTGTVIQQLDSHLTLRSITGIRGYDDKGAYENTGDLYSRSSALLYYRDRTDSEEVRLDGQWSRFSFTSGVYFLYEDWRTDRRVNNIYGAVTNNPTKLRYQPVDALIDQQNHNLALYGIGHYKITPVLTASIGARLNYEQHSNSEILRSLGSTVGYTTGAANDLNALFNTPPGAIDWTASAHASWLRLLPKGSLEWQAVPHAMLYATISQGGKSAGFDPRGQSPTVPSQARLPYGPETVTTYEIGAKTDPAPGRLWLNGALFYNNFNNIQITTTDSSTGLSHRYNAGDGHSLGAELEATLHPLPGWEVSATGSYLFAELDRFRGTYTHTLYATELLVNATPHSGERLPYSPRFQADLQASYSFAVQHLPGRLRLGGDVSYQSAVFTDALENSYTRLPDQTYINAQLAWTAPSRRWTLTLSGRNLADRRPQSLALLQSGGMALLYSASYADPRTVFLSLRYTM